MVPMIRGYLYAWSLKRFITQTVPNTQFCYVIDPVKNKKIILLPSSSLQRRRLLNFDNHLPNSGHHIPSAQPTLMKSSIFKLPTRNVVSSTLIFNIKPNQNLRKSK